VLNVDVRMLAGDALRPPAEPSSSACAQASAAHDVADRPDGRRLVLQAPSTATKPALVELEPDRSDQPIVFGTRPIETISLSTLEFLLLAGRVGVRDTTPPLPDLTPLIFTPRWDLQPLLGERLLRFLRDLLVDGAEDPGNA